MSSLLILCVLAIIAVLAYYLAMGYGKYFYNLEDRDDIMVKFKKTQKKGHENTLFILAHPDDECMFFTPTIYAMKEWSNLYLLVLSNGGYDGLGKIREREMEAAAKQMGFKGCCVLDKADIPDGPHEWNIEAAIRHIEDHINLR